MARKDRARLRMLTYLVTEARPDLDPVEAIRGGLVLVDGRIVANPASLVRGDASIVIRPEGGQALRGEAKLATALRTFCVSVEGRIALDLGAAAGGFTRVLVRAGATRVYAVDVGYGQLLGSLRQHPAVVNLERTNLAVLSPVIVPDTIDVVTADLSYLALAQAVPQLSDRVALAPDADLLAVVKPQFELAFPSRRRRDPSSRKQFIVPPSASNEADGWSSEAWNRLREVAGERWSFSSMPAGGDKSATPLPDDR